MDNFTSSRHTRRGSFDHQKKLLESALNKHSFSLGDLETPSEPSGAQDLEQGNYAAHPTAPEEK